MHDLKVGNEKLEVSEPIKKDNETSITRDKIIINACSQKYCTLYSYLTLTLTSNTQHSCAGFRATNSAIVYNIVIQIKLVYFYVLF